MEMEAGDRLAKRLLDQKTNRQGCQGGNTSGQSNMLADRLTSKPDNLRMAGRHMIGWT
jgi:hypothetical protein